MSIITGTHDNFDKEVIKSDKTVLVDFNANWCGPCRMMSPILENIAEENDKVKIVSVNIDDEDELAEEYEVGSIPCLVVFKDGKEINRSVGLQPKDDVIKLIGD